MPQTASPIHPPRVRSSPGDGSPETRRTYYAGSRNIVPYPDLLADFLSRNCVVSRTLCTLVVNSRALPARRLHPNAFPTRVSAPGNGTIEWQEGRGYDRCIGSESWGSPGRAPSATGMLAPVGCAQSAPDVADLLVV